MEETFNKPNHTVDPTDALEARGVRRDPRQPGRVRAVGCSTSRSLTPHLAERWGQM